MYEIEIYYGGRSVTADGYVAFESMLFYPFVNFMEVSPWPHLLLIFLPAFPG